MTTEYAISVTQPGLPVPGERRHGPLRRIGRRARALLRLIARRRRERRGLDDLRHLDERTLRDLGITRSELPSVAAELQGRAGPTRRRIEEPLQLKSLRIRAVDTSL